jgi:MFS family permease
MGHRNQQAFRGGCLAGAAVSWNLTNTGAIAQVLGRHYHTGLVAIGLLTSIAFAAEFIVMVPGGRAIDRLGARRVALASIAVCAAGNALLLVVPGIGGALFLRWLIGFGVGAGFVAGSVWIAEDARGRTPLGQGLYGGFSLAGAGAATGVVPLLETLLGWRSSYVTGLAVAVLALAAASVCAGAAGHGGSHAPTTLRALLGSRTIARLGVLHAASFAVAVVVGNWIVTLLTRRLGISYGEAGLLGALTLLLGIVGRPLGGFVARRSPQHGTAVVAAALLGCAAATAALAVSHSVAVDAVAAVLLGLASGLPFGIIVARAAQSFPDSLGEAIGAFNLYAVTSIVIAMPLVGLTFSNHRTGTAGLLAVAAFAVVSVAATRRFSEPRREAAAT